MELDANEAAAYANMTRQLADGARHGATTLREATSAQRDFRLGRVFTKGEGPQCGSRTENKAPRGAPETSRSLWVPEVG